MPIVTRIARLGKTRSTIAIDLTTAGRQHKPLRIR
jgi:hypothetical protein